MLRSLIAFVFVLVCVAAADAATPIERYEQLTSRRLAAAHEAAVALQHAVTTLFAEPNDATLESARLAWRHAKNMFMMTEPLYLPTERSEGLRSVFPPGIYDPPLLGSGFGPAEYDLWGKDEKLNAPGNRPLAQFIGDDADARERRKGLPLIAEFIVNDLGRLQRTNADSSSPRVAQFRNLPSDESLKLVLNRLAETATDLATSYIDEPLTSRTREPSPHSDNTVEDLHYTIEGMRQVVAALEPQTTERMAELLDRAGRAARGIHAHMDYLIAAPADHPERRALEQIAADLHAVAREAKAAATSGGGASGGGGH